MWFQRNGLAVFVLMMLIPSSASAGKLLVGAAQCDTTPKLPVSVTGQFPMRIATTIETPLQANVLVVQTGDRAAPDDYAVFVACDLVYIPDELLRLVRQRVAERLPELDTRKIVLNATHTHTAPVLLDDKYPIPKKGVTQPKVYREFFADRVAEGIEKAWKNRCPGAVTWGLGHAVVAYNRRAVYADGRAQMYGPTNKPDFMGLEGYEDHDINTLFFWQLPDRLAAVAVNVSCPSQEVEGRRTVNADFWHPIRQTLRKKYGKELAVLGWTGAAGDQSPHLMYRKAADDRMRTLRGLTRLEEIARRVVRAVEDTYEVVREDRHDAVPLAHRVEKLSLPMRIVTPEQYREAKQEVDRAMEKMKKDPKTTTVLYRRMKWYAKTVERFEEQQKNPKPTCETEIHVIRIGDAVVCTNRFELFTDFGIRIKGRSPAVQTIVVQLAGPGTYLPTRKAVRGGHYSAVVHSSLVGPEGGKILVDRTVALIEELFNDQ